MEQFSQRVQSLDLREESLVNDLSAQRARLEDLRTRRKLLQERSHKINLLREQVDTLVQTNIAKRNRILKDTIGLERRLQKDQETLDRLSKWNVLAGDAFYIDCAGDLRQQRKVGSSVATINGLRLGSDISRSESPTKSNTATSAPTFFSFTNPSDPTSSSKSVPWKEINAALGHTALLLSQLEQTLGVESQYEIMASGSTSRIGLRRNSASLTAPTAYNLYYTDDSFQFFAKRNFNTALQHLLACTKELSEIVVLADRSVMLPYEINGETIGGLSILYFQNDKLAADWTRAMKYLLTNLKHVLKSRFISQAGTTAALVP